MQGLCGPDEYGIAVCGYTSDLGVKNLQSEWYEIKVPDPEPDPDPNPFVTRERQRLSDLSFSAKEKEKVKINPSSAKELLHRFSVFRMMYRSTQHAFLDLRGPIYGSDTTPQCTHLFSIGGLDPVGSDSDGDGAHLKVWSLELKKRDADWEAVPLMTYPNRYNPQSVALRHKLDDKLYSSKLYVLGGFSKSQFPAEAAADGVGWMESYDPVFGWIRLPNPPPGFSINDDPLIFTPLEDKGEILLAQYNHDDMDCDSATFYVYSVKQQRWTTLDPPVRKLLARYPDRTGRRSVAVRNTLYWGLIEDEDINVQAYDLYADKWFHGSFNIRPVLEKGEFLADDVFPASPPLLHLANQKFCLFLLTSIYDEKNCEVSNHNLYCLILDVSEITDEGDNHQHDYYDHVCYKVRGDVNVDDKEDNANYHFYRHDHFWRLSISIVSVQKHPLVNPIQLWDAGVLFFNYD